MRGELESEQTATYWPPSSFVFGSTSFSSAGLLNRRSWGLISLCWVLVLSTVSYLQLTYSKLTRTLCRTGLYHCLTSTCFLWASHLHPIQPVHSQGYTLISSTRFTYFSINNMLRSMEVNMLQIFISVSYFYIRISKVKLATLVEGDPKGTFSIASTPRCRGGRYSFPWISSTLLYIMLSVKQGVPFFESFVWLDLGLNSGFTGHWRPL